MDAHLALPYMMILGKRGSKDAFKNLHFLAHVLLWFACSSSPEGWKLSPLCGSVRARWALQGEGPVGLLPSEKMSVVFTAWNISPNTVTKVQAWPFPRLQFPIICIANRAFPKSHISGSVLGFYPLKLQAK